MGEKNYCRDDQLAQIDHTIKNMDNAIAFCSVARDLMLERGNLDYGWRQRIFFIALLIFFDESFQKLSCLDSEAGKSDQGQAARKILHQDYG